MTTSVFEGREPWTRMVIAISGSSGLIGSALVRALEDHGSDVRRIVRRAARSEHEISWDPARGTIDRARLEGVDAVINLAGENLAQRWTSDARRRIHKSRVGGTALIARALAGLARRPRVLLSGSAIGIYGSRGDEALDETSTLGHDFLAGVCREWEAASAPAADAGVRVVSLRTGLVVSRDGGVLRQLLLPFRLGVGGRAGSGRQWMSWIAPGDYTRIIALLLGRESISGAVNLVAPNPVTNDEFARTLARVLGRPSLIPVPTLALKAMFGEMAEGTILASQRVVPRRLLDAGFEFSCPTLEAALRAELVRDTSAGRH